MDNNRILEDIYFVAALLSYDVELLHIDRENRRHQKFKFRNLVPMLFIHSGDGVVETRKDVTVEEAETLFLSNRLLFPPSYPEKVRQVKSIIYSNDR